MKVIVLSSYQHIAADKLQKLGCDYKNPAFTPQRYVYTSEEHSSVPAWHRVVESELNTLEAHLDSAHFKGRTYFPFVGIFDATEPPVINAAEDGSILITAEHTADKRAWEFKSEFFARSGDMRLYPEYYQYGDVEFEWAVMVDGKTPNADVKLYSILAHDIGSAGNGIVCMRASLAHSDGNVYTYEDGKFDCMCNAEIRTKLQQEWQIAMQHYEKFGLSWPYSTTTEAFLSFVKARAMADPVDG